MMFVLTESFRLEAIASRLETMPISFLLLKRPSHGSHALWIPLSPATESSPVPSVSMYWQRKRIPVPRIYREPGYGI